MQTENTNAPIIEDEVPKFSLEEFVRRASSLISRGALDSGELAALRRGKLSPISRRAASACRLIAGCGYPLNSLSRDHLQRVSFVAEIIAQLSSPGHNAYTENRSCGRALAESGVKENRMRALLEARGERLRVRLIRMARFLRAHGLPCQFTPLCALAYVENESRIEKLMYQIAKDYFATIQEDKR